jgi:hypothetical protein
MAESKMPASLTSLIERIEAATEGSRELDGLIWKAICEKPGDVWANDVIDGDVWLRRDPIDHVAWEGPPAYSTSIDAALTLLPEGFKWKCGYSRHVPHNAEVIDYSAHTGTFIGESDASRCLALLAAILRARQSEFINDKA